MKALLFVATCLLLITACSKSSVTPTPDAGSVVAGTYNLTYYDDDSASVKSQYVFPVTGPNNTTIATGTLVARRDSANVSYLTQMIIQPGYPTKPDVFGQINLKANGTSYDLYQYSQKIGTADGTILNIDVQYTDPQTGIAYRNIRTAKK